MKKTRSELKREAILVAAKQAFLESGVAGTSMDKLASLANVSKRTVYNHFSSKEELVIELISSLWREAVQQIDVTFHPEQSLHDQFEKILLAELNASCSPDYIEIARVIFGHYLFSPEELRKQVDKFSKKESAIASWIKAAVEHGSIKECDIELFTEQSYTLIKGVYFWPLLAGMRDFPSQKEKDVHVKNSVDLLLTYYKA
ncbi:transcriptional regulator, tetR family [Vibrio ishigakensis]|uniref:Transcriptional regulator, tetR family n=1 Tax=Vibrio ishigakensis TaxID=1481914 RepID=A0A0B8P3N0_9VIBR|nr:TetR/AcrR family transcriptional regulator [Vibrio ishigakensis]GAM57594.1 transcriptional regulator, tetR family [Vibrio ishigakensis]